MPPPSTASPGHAPRHDSAATPASAAGPTPASPAGTALAAAGNAAFASAVANGGYFIDLGAGITISPEDMSASVNLLDKPQLIPGVLLRELRYNQRRRTATVLGDITIPHVRSPRNGISVSIDAEGRTSLDATLTSDLPVFRNKSLQVTLDEQHNLAATLEIAPTDLMPARGGMRNLTVTGGGVFHLANGKLSGNLEADLVYTKLGSGHFTFNFTGEGRASGAGSFNFEQDFLRGASATLQIDEAANLKAEVTIPVTEIQTPIPGLSITEGSVRFSMDNSTPGGALEGLRMNYNGLGDATLNATVRNGQFSGNGTFAVSLPELTDVSGRLNFAAGVLTGSVTIQPRHFPTALQVREGSITATLTESGDIDLAGEATIQLGPAGTGQLRALRENGLITIGTTITLEDIPGLQSGSFSLSFTSAGAVEGEADIATDDSLVPGLSGSVHVTYRDNLWSGETEINYTREDPSIEGSVTVRVRQTEEGVLVFSGEGELTVQITPGVEGTAGVVIDEEGNVVLTFAFTQTEPYELFAEQRREREFVNITRNIPLWAGIVVAVIRIRAGARAGVGPGQIRNTRVEGEWEVSSDAPPDFSISSEFYMPAFVEGYVAFGAGLGLDVLLGSLTGGIEAMATAGIYGAISVVPELSYENGDWMFDGTATLAAGARLKLSLNAWAEVEALWITVWERSWELASHTMNIGPDLVLRANVAMNLSNPTVPEITFESSDVDSEGLIDSAMPEDGPPAAGTREALENRAEWAGRSREPGPAADTVPAELASQANETEAAPAAPPRPPQRTGPPAGAAEGETPASTTAPTPSAEGGPNTARPAVAGEAAVAGPRVPSVPESEVLGTEQPRYPTPVTLATLNEPPAPMPRTVAQEREDLQAAAQVFALAEAQAEDSEQLAGYFERIRQRFHLTSIAYEAVGDDIQVRISINPDVVLHPSELVKGSGIAGKQSSITYSPGTMSGSSSMVGMEMIADPLGPDHPAGDGPGGQGDLMGRLQTDPGLPEDQKYIRGHLLNDRVGGAGESKNLFPITAAANRLHEQRIESKVKQWVNSDRYWVYYKVSVSVREVEIDDPAKITSNKVNASFACEASVFDMRGRKQNRVTATIVSTYRAPAEVVDETAPSRLVRITARPEDLAADIEHSSREGSQEYKLHEKIFADLNNVLGHKSWSTIRDALVSIAGLGGSRLDTLQNAYLLSGPNRVDIGDHLATATEKANLTIINGLFSQIHGALMALI